MEVVSHHFRPESINRIDEVVVFHPLAKENPRDCRNSAQTLLYKRLEEHGLSGHDY